MNGLRRNSTGIDPRAVLKRTRTCIEGETVNGRVRERTLHIAVLKRTRTRIEGETAVPAKEACMGIVIRVPLWNPIFGRTIRHHVSSRRRQVFQFREPASQFGRSRRVAPSFSTDHVRGERASCVGIPHARRQLCSLFTKLPRAESKN